MMNKITLLLAVLLVSNIAFGQQFPKEKTGNHILIEGTNVYVVPPAAFQASPSFKGFQNPNDPSSMIMAVEIPGPYQEVSKGFNKETLATQGMELKQKTAIQIAEMNGLLIELNQTSNGFDFSKHILVYGDEQATMVLNGVYLKDSLQLGEEIKKSILTTYYDATLKTDPRAALSYSIDGAPGALQFHSVMGNGMLFNRDLKTPTQSEDRVNLVTDKSFTKVEIGDKKTFCISRLEKYPDNYALIESKGINEVEIDGLSGFELYASSEAYAEEEMYQVILFDEEGNYYLFVGTYLAEKENAISDVKKVIQTFRRK